MPKPEAAPVPMSFNPAANKKKLGGSKKQRLRTAKDKKERIWGKTPQKPYISSSLGDMTRVMMRYACMENTYFYNTEPPPVEFYNYWQKFTVEQQKLPSEYVDKKKTSIANLKKNTSSFDFFGTYTLPIHSQQDLDEGGAGQKQKRRILTSDAQDISDIWKDVRISMSSESFISSSTKISENASVVPMETGWDEACSEDYQSSESDFGLDVQDKCRHHRHGQHHKWATGLEAFAHPVELKKHSSLEFHTAQGLIDKQTNAIAQSILTLQKKDNRIIYELCTQARDMDIIDHFADDIDDSFLLDSYSYTDLPDEAFGPNFDFLNEDVLKGKKGKKAKKAGDGQKRKGNKGNSAGDEADEDDIGVTTTPSEMGTDPCVDTPDDTCQKGASKKGKGREGRKGKHEKDGDESTQRGEGGYDACMERRRRRIEEVLRNAVRSRSPMGSFRPKEGEEPLSRYKEQSSPGPAAYNPNLYGTKPNIYTAFMAPRWTDNIYESPGPGPCAYIPTNKCTCEMLTLHEAPRFPEDETLGPGPANVDLSGYYGTAKGKPRATIVSRKYKDRPDCGAQFTNVYGLTRFGKANPPNPLIVSRNDLPDKSEPGPGEYDTNEVNKRIGITIKSRIPIGENEKRPGYLALPDLMGTGPTTPIGIREFMERKDQSPGPIYRPRSPKTNGISLTFKPFPMKGAELEPSPIEWGTAPGEGRIKTLPRAPDPYLYGRRKPIGEKHQPPGPNAYDICLECEDCIEPGATIAGRYPIKTEILPGPADYDPKPLYGKPPFAVFQHKKPEKQKPWDDRPYGDGDSPKYKIPGGIIAPRWKSKESEKGGPELLNIFGCNNRGNKTGIPISLKSRHTPFKYSHIADAKRVPYDNTSCVTKLNLPKTIRTNQPCMK